MEQRRPVKTNVDSCIEKAIENIKNDRAMAATLLTDIMLAIKTDNSKHQQYGPVAAKYLETLQRSNEQYVKIVTLLEKKSAAQKGLSEEDKLELYDMIGTAE
jgi:hypothetical protein